jgi:hypothetical protein
MNVNIYIFNSSSFLVWKEGRKKYKLQVFGNEVLRQTWT